jgi:hypothetical protein
MLGWFGIFALFLLCGAPLAPPDTEVVKERFGAWAIVGNGSAIRFDARSGRMTFLTSA